MDKIKKTASKVRSVSDKKSENALFGSKPVLADKPLSANRDKQLLLNDSERASSTSGTSLVRATSLEDINSDSDSIISKNKTKRIEQEAIQAFELEKCTTIIFI